MKIVGAENKRIKVILYCVQCYALHWTGSENFDLWTMFIMYFCCFVQCFLVACMHATFWIGIEQCSNRRRNLVPDETCARFAWHT